MNYRTNSQTTADTSSGHALEYVIDLTQGMLANQTVVDQHGYKVAVGSQTYLSPGRYTLTSYGGTLQVTSSNVPIDYLVWSTLLKEDGSKVIVFTSAQLPPGPYLVELPQPPPAGQDLVLLPPQQMTIGFDPLRNDCSNSPEVLAQISSLPNDGQGELARADNGPGAVCTLPSSEIETDKMEHSVSQKRRHFNILRACGRRRQMRSREVGSGNGASSKSPKLKLPKLPLDTIVDLLEMEENLKMNSSYKEALLHRLTDVGGKSLRNCHKNVMEELMTEDLRLKLSWKGQRGKDQFKCFEHIRKVVHEAVPLGVREPKWDQDTHDSYCKEFLKKAPSKEYLKTRQQLSGKPKTAACDKKNDSSNLRVVGGE